MDLNEYQLSLETAEKPCEKCAIGQEQCFKIIDTEGFMPCGAEFNHHGRYMIPKQLTDKEIQDKLDNLRKERNKHNDEASMLQKEIDKWELELHHVPDYTNHYLRIQLSKGNITYLYANQIKRLFHGIKIYSNIIVEVYEWRIKTCIDEDLTFDVGYNNIPAISIITKEEFENEIKESFDYVYSLVKMVDNFSTNGITNINIIADIPTT